MDLRITRLEWESMTAARQRTQNRRLLIISILIGIANFIQRMIHT